LSFTRIIRHHHHARRVTPIHRMGSQSSRAQPYPREHHPGLFGRGSHGFAGRAGPSSHQLTTQISGHASDSDDLVPVVFTWTQGAQDVKLCIEEFGWQEIPMCRSGIDFNVVSELPRGKHRYKFLVDGEFQFAPNQQTDIFQDGDKSETVNIINLEDFDKNMFLEDPSSFVSEADLVYTQRLPDISEYTADAPHIPSLLNKSPYVAIDPPPKSLPPNVPLHCICHHVYHDGGSTLRRYGLKMPVILLSTTHRYEKKFSTTIFIRRSEMMAQNNTEPINPLKLCMKKSEL